MRATCFPKETGMSPLLPMMGLSFKKMIWAFFAIVLVLAGIVATSPADAQGSPEKRIALVVGNAAYKTGALPTPATVERSL